MKILILGNGYLSKNIKESINSKKTTVLNVSKENTNYQYLHDLIQRENIDVLINTIGILKEKKGNTFTNSHVDSVKLIIDLIKSTNIKLIHISALGVGDNINTKYFKTKEEGEKLILDSNIKFTIIRPSILWGKNDKSISFFVKIIKYFHIFPLFSGGKYLIQPIYIDDLTQYIAKIIKEKGNDNRIVEIAGPKMYMFKEMISVLAKKNKSFVLKISIPKFLSRAIAKLGNYLPLPINHDQLIMLESGNYLKRRGNNRIIQITTTTSIDKY